MFNLFSFGYIPQGHFWQDLCGRVCGVPNLFKRLQSRVAMKLIDPKETEKILDFGCGAGFFGFECAKRGSFVTGADLHENLKQSYSFGIGHFQYVKLIADQKLPFESHSFDKIIMSEIFVVLNDPLVTLQELQRVLKTTGTLVVLNTLGRLNIQKAFKQHNWILNFLRKRLKFFPNSYEDYTENFLKTDGVNLFQWYSLAELVFFLNKSGFKNIQVTFPYKSLAISIFNWIQFYRFGSQKSLAVNFSLPLYLVLELANLFSRRRDDSNVVIIAKP